MKTLQNDLTTIEQSKRLLELGVPKNSANHYYGKDGKLHYIDGTIPYSLLWETGCTPCWSVGRLIEISELCYTSLSDNDYFIRQKDCNTDFLIKMFELGAEIMDFSKWDD